MGNLFSLLEKPMIIRDRRIELQRLERIRRRRQRKFPVETDLDIIVPERIPVEERIAHDAHGRVNKITRLERDPAREIAIGSSFHDNLAALEPGQVDGGKLRERIQLVHWSTEDGGRRQDEETESSA